MPVKSGHSPSRPRAVAGAAIMLLALAMAAAPPLRAQTLPPIYDKAPVQPAPITTVAEFGKGRFLENIAVDAHGDLFISSYLDGRILRIDASGRSSAWATVDGTIAGIALNPDGSALVSGWIKGKEPAVFSISPQGRSETLVRLPGGQFPNGVLRIGTDRFLVADSYRGAIWEVDSARKTAQIWLEHELLARPGSDNPTPAVNGIKLFGGALYASNTAKQLLVKIPIVDGKAGAPQVQKSSLGLDDFDFDAAGNLYGATHVYNSLVRVARDGKVTVLAGLAQGMAGSTAVAVRPAGGGMVAYVTTNGGLSLPPEGGVQPGRVVKVELPAAP